MSGSVWPMAVLVWALLPGLVALFPGRGGAALRLLPLAPLPALAFALAGAPGTLEVPDLLLGVALAGVPGAALLLGMIAAVWAVAGLHAALTLADGRHRRGFAGFWSVTLAGNLGVVLAADVVTFYLAFAAVSLAAWGLVVHDRSAAALAAGRVYIVLAVAGEAALLAGLLIGIDAAGGLGMAEVRAALPDAPLGGLATGLLVAGFGIKAGMVPLHVWLPLAHPVAPVPGSAVLSGAIVKAGLVGMLVLLPAGGAWAALVTGAGLAGAFGAALWGLTQTRPKAVLAYSTVSQMGLMLVLAAAGGGGAVLYALHHGLAKAALFLLVGVLAAGVGRWRRRAALLLAGLVAASVAGLPLTGGALVKAAAKDALAPALAQAVTVSGVTTALLLAWVLYLLARAAPPTRPAPHWGALMAGTLALAGAALAVPWLVWTTATDLPATYPLGRAVLRDAAWPVALGLAAFWLLRRVPLPEQPPGDLLTLPRPTLRLPRWPQPATGLRPRHWWRRARRALLRSRRAEDALRRWPVAGSVLVGTALVLALLTR